MATGYLATAGLALTAGAGLGAGAALGTGAGFGTGAALGAVEMIAAPAALNRLTDDDFAVSGFLGSSALLTSSAVPDKTVVTIEFLVIQVYILGIDAGAGLDTLAVFGVKALEGILGSGATYAAA